jgi:hypothetical protein
MNRATTALGPPIRDTMSANLLAWQGILSVGARSSNPELIMCRATWAPDSSCSRDICPLSWSRTTALDSTRVTFGCQPRFAGALSRSANLTGWAAARLRPGHSAMTTGRRRTPDRRVPRGFRIISYRLTSRSYARWIPLPNRLDGGEGGDDGCEVGAGGVAALVGVSTDRGQGRVGDGFDLDRVERVDQGGRRRGCGR